MASPSPLPLLWVPLSKGRSILACVSLSMPSPVSVTLKATRAVSPFLFLGSAFKWILRATVPPDGVYWTALLVRLPCGRGEDEEGE